MDLTTTIAGPHCGRLLVDVGAKVIEIEIEPLDGELLRDRMSWHILRSEYQAFPVAATVRGVGTGDCPEIGGSCRHGTCRVWTGEHLKPMAEPWTECPVVDYTANLQQEIGALPSPALSTCLIRWQPMPPASHGSYSMQFRICFCTWRFSGPRRL
jgi:hypothetical protein